MNAPDNSEIFLDAKWQRCSSPAYSAIVARGSELVLGRRVTATTLRRQLCTVVCQRYPDSLDCLGRLLNTSTAMILKRYGSAGLKAVNVATAARAAWCLDRSSSQQQ